jgi:hypothetical protein
MRYLRPSNSMMKIGRRHADAESADLTGID